MEGHVDSRPWALAHWLREGQGGLVALAVATGAGSGCLAIAFGRMITAFTRLFTGFTDYSLADHAANPHVSVLGRYFVLLVPIVAGLLYGPLVSKFAPEARSGGVAEVVYAVAKRGGRIPPQVAVVKPLAAAICLGGGGSLGREGPMVQIGAAWASTVGQAIGVPERRLRILAACGAAGGVAATFNAPLGAPLFVLELIFRDFALDSVGAVLLSSAVATAMSRPILGRRPFLDVPAFAPRSGWEYLAFALLGLVIGAAGLGYTHGLVRIQEFADRVWRGPQWVRPAAGGLLLGAMLLVLPQLYGVGYPVVVQAIDGRYTFLFLVVLMVAKLAAAGISLGIGGSGGVFAPVLFIGATGGTAFGAVVHDLFPAGASPGLYGLIGMAAAFAGGSRGVLTAVVIVAEMSGRFSLLLPLATAVLVASALSRAVSSETLYTLRLVRCGLLEPRKATNGRHQGRGCKCGRLMEPDCWTTGAGSPS